MGVCVSVHVDDFKVFACAQTVCMCVCPAWMNLGESKALSVECEGCYINTLPTVPTYSRTHCWRQPRAALADILYKNGENGASERATAGSPVLTRLCLGWTCSLFSLLWLLIADSASQRDSQEVLRSLSPDDLKAESKGFGNLHQIQERGELVRALSLIGLHDKSNMQQRKTPAHESTSCIFAPKNGKQMQESAHTQNQTHTCSHMHTKNEHTDFEKAINSR